METNFNEERSYRATINNRNITIDNEILKERMEKNTEITKILFQAIDILGNRLTKAENLI
jgi:hypothetical protein